VAAVILVFAVGLPLLNAAISTDNVSAAGAVYDVGLGVRITPVADWSTTSVSREGSGLAQFTRSGSYLTARALRFPGSTLDAFNEVAAEIGAQDGVQLTTNAVTFTTVSGLVGIASTFASPSEQGYFAVFTANGVLATVIAEGPPDAFHALDREILLMIYSIRIGPAHE
jgi:hypothetical protein